MASPRIVVTRTLLFLLVLYGLAGAQSTGAAELPNAQLNAKQPKVVEETPVTVGSYILSAGDVIDIKFVYNPEMNESIGLRPDGSFALAMIGEVHAAGLSPAALAEQLME